MNIFWLTVVGILLGQAPAAGSTDLAASVRRAYGALPAAELLHKRLPHKPTSRRGFTEVDVSEKMRSASFGHTTSLLIPRTAAPSVFYVHHGRSTNAPEAYFGPFKLEALSPAAPDPTTASPGVTCGSVHCGTGQVCCNPSCGICAGPNEACTQQICANAGAPDR